MTSNWFELRYYRAGQRGGRPNSYYYNARPDPKLVDITGLDYDQVIVVDEVFVNICREVVNRLSPGAILKSIWLVVPGEFELVWKE